MTGRFVTILSQFRKPNITYLHKIQKLNMKVIKTSSNQKSSLSFINCNTMGSVDKKASVDVKHKQYELVPPDGGWGYLVSLAIIINFSTTTAFGSCFGMLYNDFIIATGMSSTSVTLLSGIFCMSCALAGFFTSPLLRIMSTRKLACAGAVIFSMGCFGTVVMTTPILFFISQGMMQGAGLGLLFNLCYSVLNEYFLKKKVLVMSFIQTATGVTTMVAPIFVKWSLEQYGSRGTLLIIAGLTLHNFFAVLMMQPVKWHLKKIEVTETSEEKLLLEDRKDVTKTETPVIKISDLEGNTKNPFSEKSLEINEEGEKKSTMRKVLELFIDTSLCKTFLFSCASFGPAVCTATDGLYLVMLPQYLYFLGWSQENVAMSITAYGFGDLAMRIIFIFVSKFVLKLGIQESYIIGVAIAVISRLGILWTSNVTAILVFFMLMGVAHCCIVVLVPLVISDTVVPEKFTPAMGMSILFTGLFGVAVGPIVGAIRDLTDSYWVAFYTATSFYAGIFVLWPIELFIKRKRRQNIKTSRSSQLNKEPK